MDWTELKNKVYYWDGMYPDIYVEGINSEDWKNWVEVVNDKYRISWHNGKADRREIKIDFNTIKEYWDGHHDICSIANIFINDIQINVHFWDDLAFENDIDPREFKTINDHNNLVEYLKLVSKIFKKEVIVGPYNCQNVVLMKVSGDKIEICL